MATVPGVNIELDLDMTRVSRFVVPFIVYAITINAHAGACLATDGSVLSGTIDASAIVSNPEDNVSGHSSVLNISSANVEHKPTVCSCSDQENPSYAVWDWARYELPTEEYGGKKYAVVNDYLSVQLSQKIDSVDTPVPYENKRHGSVTNVCEDSGTSGGSPSEIVVRIRKPFVGHVEFNHVLIYSKGANASSGDATRIPEIQYYLTGSVTVQQKCVFTPDSVITFNFGDIGASSFSEAGAGNKPTDVKEQHLNAVMKCSNIDGETLLTLRLEANESSGYAIKSDNKDLGFIVAEGNDELKKFKPNDTSDRHYFRLDDASVGTVRLTAWPVSITGNKPAEGTFTAEGYLRVDFD